MSLTGYLPPTRYVKDLKSIFIQELFYFSKNTIKPQSLGSMSIIVVKDKAAGRQEWTSG